MLDVQKFLKQYQNVVTWNLVACNSVHNFEQDAINRQGGYVREEVKETMLGIMQENHKEVLDGIADVFVTLTYKHFLISRGVIFEEEIAKLIQFMNSEGRTNYEDQYLRQQHLLDTAIWVRNENDSDVFDSTSLCSLIELLELGEQYYNIDILDVVEHVMDSNWSKYSSVNCDVDFEVQYISQKNPDRKDIVGVLNQEHNVIVFRTDNGIGKIMKPSTFWNADCSRFL